MKTTLRFFCALCALVAYFNNVRAETAVADESSFKLTIELRDGSRVVGKSLDDSLGFHSSALGDSKILWVGVRSLVFTDSSNSARLTATNGDTFTIQLSADTLRVDTGFGKTELPVKLIRSVKISLNAKPATPAAPVAAVPASSQLTIELRDGSHVVVKGLDDTLTFHSAAVGDLKLAWVGIRSLEYATPDSDMGKLTATNGDAYVVQLLASTLRVETSFGKKELPVNLIRSITVSTTEKSLENGDAWENSLGMKFMPVRGTKVMFCIWDVRVKDYAAYEQMTGGAAGNRDETQYEGVPVTPSADCPVVNVSWDEAKAFCAWLTQKERAAGKIKGSQNYRLPRAGEWQQAAGDTKYPWGVDWPPPPGSGNYADTTAKQSFGDLLVMQGYDDGFAVTSPVGSFKANKYGLYDMGGNVTQWCEDLYNMSGSVKNHVLCGASWRDASADTLLSSYPIHHMATSRGNSIGFRVVLEDASSR